jgi:hypothetical protein
MYYLTKSKSLLLALGMPSSFTIGSSDAALIIAWLGIALIPRTRVVSGSSSISADLSTSIHVLDLDQADVLEHLRRNVLDVLFVFLRYK